MAEELGYFYLRLLLPQLPVVAKEAADMILLLLNSNSLSANKAMMMINVDNEKLLPLNSKLN